jgi:hypothetical protein
MSNLLAIHPRVRACGMTFLARAVGALFVGGIMSAAASTEARTGDRQVEHLIDQFQQVGEEGVGFHATAWTEGFICVNSEPQFVGAISGAP